MRYFLLVLDLKGKPYFFELKVLCIRICSHQNVFRWEWFLCDWHMAMDVTSTEWGKMSKEWLSSPVCLGFLSAKVLQPWPSTVGGGGCLCGLSAADAL